MFLKAVIKLAFTDTLAAWSNRAQRAKLRAGGVALHPQAILILKTNNYSFGKGVTIDAFNYVCVVPDATDPTYDGGLFVGDEVYIGQWNNIRAAGGVIRIGKGTMVSQMVSILAANHQMKRDQPIWVQPTERTRTGVTIGEDVWLGAGSTILPGVEIGNGAVIAAGAVVRENVPAFAIYGGVPAKPIGIRDAPGA